MKDIKDLTPKELDELFDAVIEAFADRIIDIVMKKIYGESVGISIDDIEYAQTLLSKTEER